MVDPCQTNVHSRAVSISVLRSLVAAQPFKSFANNV
jgi:hypothetical protein